jgi:hypothetical protein
MPDHLLARQPAEGTARERAAWQLHFAKKGGAGLTQGGRW